MYGEIVRMNQTDLKYCNDINNNIYLYGTHDGQAQGIVSFNNKFIVPGMPVPKEIIVTDEEINNINLANHIIMPSLEGSLIRVMHCDNKWIISTNKKLNAFQSYWGSNKSFGDLFFENIQKTDPSILSMLDKEKIYIFFLKTDRNTKIVCNQENQENLTLFGTYEKINSDTPVVKMPDIIYDQSNIIEFKTIDDMRAYINSSNENNITRQGLILFNIDSSSNPQIIKILDPKYKFLFDIRNNNPSVQARFLELLLQDKNHLEKFVHVMYPERNQEFISIWKNFCQMIDYLSSAYIQRHIQCNPDTYISPSILHHFVEDLHGYISLNKIILGEDTKNIKPILIEIFKNIYNGHEIMNMLKKFSC